MAARATYRFVKSYLTLYDNNNEQNGWEQLFYLIEEKARCLESPLVSVPYNYRVAGGHSSVGEVTSDEMIVYMRLICCVVQDSESADDLMNLSVNPIETLFALLLTKVECELKGAIFHALAALAKNVPNRQAAQDIWIILDRYQLLPTPNNCLPQWSNLRQNLNAVERKVTR